MLTACTFAAFIDTFRWKMVFETANNVININLLTDQIPIKFGPSIGHTLLTAQTAWKRSLTTDDQSINKIYLKFFL